MNKKILKSTLAKFSLLFFFLFGIPFKASSEFYISGGLMAHSMYQKEKESAPNPITPVITFGGMLFSEKKICLDFSGTFMMNYFDYSANGKTVYTEVENRTALGFGIMLDCTARYNKVIGNHRFTAGGGLGLLGRFGMKADGVPSDEEWKIDKINDSFWEPTALFYPTVALSWLYHAGENIQAGLEMKFFIGITELKFTLAAKFALGKCSRVYEFQKKSLEMKSDSGSIGSESL